MKGYQKDVVSQLGPEGWVVDSSVGIGGSGMAEGGKLVLIHEKAGVRVLVHGSPQNPSQALRYKVAEARRRVQLAESSGGKFVDWLRKEHHVPKDGSKTMRLSLERVAADWLRSQSDSHLMPSAKALAQTIRVPNAFEVVESHGRGGSDCKIYGKAYIGEPVAEDAKKTAVARELQKVAAGTAGVDLCGRAVECDDGSLAVCNDTAEHSGMHTDTLKKFGWRDCEVKDSEYADSVCNRPAGHSGSHRDRDKHREWIDVPVTRKPVAPPKPADALESVTPVKVEVEVNGAAPALPAELVDQIRAALFAEEHRRMLAAEEHAEFLTSQLRDYRKRVADARSTLDHLADDLDGAMELLGVGAEDEAVKGDPRADVVAAHV